MSKFVDELAERGLLGAARAACLPFGLLVDQLLKPREARRNCAEVVVEARARFVRHLRGIGWSYPMVADLLGYKHHGPLMEITGVIARSREDAERRTKKYAHLGGEELESGPRLVSVLPKAAP